MEEPAFKPILMQPLKMQGVVDIKDNSVIVRFKFMARPKNPSAIQRMAVPPHVRGPSRRSASSSLRRPTRSLWPRLPRCRRRYPAASPPTAAPPATEPAKAAE